uniref:Uncharacterized protein n=1 Tax=Anguilla anguilla TaxID=7936 RepID=A0A0E9UJQ0_ANGAN
MCFSVLKMPLSENC